MGFRRSEVRILSARPSGKALAEARAFSFFPSSLWFASRGRGRCRHRQGNGTLLLRRSLVPCQGTRVALVSGLVPPRRAPPPRRVPRLAKSREVQTPPRGVTA